jgi:hypothetical protein
VLMLFPSRIAGIAGIVGGLLGFDCRENRLAADIVLGSIAGPLTVGLPSADGVQHSQCGSRCIARANEAVLSVALLWSVVVSVGATRLKHSAVQWPQDGASSKGFEIVITPLSHPPRRVVLLAVLW